MKRPNIILLAALSIVLVQQDVAAQYTFDVKTQLEEKYSLQIVKHGVIRTLEASSWARVTEVGEDYSLWITNLQRYHQGELLYVVVDIELRTPAMLTAGRYIDSRRVWRAYHWQRVQQYVRDNIDINLFYRSLRTNQEQVAKAISGMIVFASNLTGDPFIGNLSGIYVAQLIEALAVALRKNPSPVEVMESILIGQEVLAGVEEMFRNPRR